MATIKKAVKKAMAKKSMAKRPMMQASAMGGGSMMKGGGKIKKAQNGADSVKTLINVPMFSKKPGKPKGTMFGSETPEGYEKIRKGAIDTGKRAISLYENRKIDAARKEQEAQSERLKKAESTPGGMGRGFRKDPKTGKMVPTEYIKKNGGKMKAGGVLSPSKKAVSKNVGNLNKAKAGASMKKCKYGCK